MNNVDNPEVREALQKRDLEDLRREMSEGFRQTHELQRATNGRVLKAEKDIGDLQTYNKVRAVENRYNKFIWYILTISLTFVVGLASYIIYNR